MYPYFVYQVPLTVNKNIIIRNVPNYQPTLFSQNGFIRHLKIRVPFGAPLRTPRGRPRVPPLKNHCFVAHGCSMLIRLK